MGLLDLFRKDPTHDWAASRAVPLRFDLARGALNGIAFDAPSDALRVLGRPSNPKPVRKRQFAYAPLGLMVSLAAKSEVHFFNCVFQAGAGGEADEFPDFVPCRITLQNERGTLLEVTSTTSRGMVEDALGPLTREEDMGDRILSTVVGRTWLGFTFDDAGRLTLLDIEPNGNGTEEIGEAPPAPGGP